LSAENQGGSGSTIQTIGNRGGIMLPDLPDLPDLPGMRIAVFVAVPSVRNRTYQRR